MTETPDRTEPIFAAAVALAAGVERAAYLDQACAGDAVLRNHVEALLRAHERDGHLLDRPVLGGLGQTGAYMPYEQPGAVIAGRYKLLEAIGKGGMGTVWVAEQTEPVRRKVALKLIKAGMDSKSVLARFEAERQALAVMDHPNIAKVLDGGLTETGRPFFVMEYIKGVPITEYCDATRLSVPDRLNLFVQVCSAVQHAHQKGIIHRDLKPSNILVAPYDDKALPKVIDFGLAKAMHQPLTERTLHTGHETVLGTPLYMSPEQAQLNNLDIDTRSDIFSLGVLLYELLTGTTPFDRKELEKAGLLEVLRVIREEEPHRPSMKVSTADALASLAASRSTEPAKLRRLLRGEIDWIVMKALEKDRTRRYETANGLATDIQRYLADEPVVAGPPGAAYRLKKFVKRHTGQVVAAALVLVALLGGVVGTTLGLVRAEAARQEAEQARQAEADRAEGERRAKLAALAAQKAEALRAEGERRAKLKADQAAAAAKRANARAQKRLQQVEKGVAILTSVFHNLDPHSEQKEGLALRVLLGNRLDEAVKQLEGEAVGDPVVVARLQSQLGTALQQLGHYEQAEVVLTNARRTLNAALGAKHPDTLTAKNNLAMLYRELGKYPQAETLLKEVLAVRTATQGAEHPDTLVAKTNLAVLYHTQGNYPAAVALYKEVLGVHAGKPGGDELQLFRIKTNLAAAYHLQRKYPQAETLFKEAIEGETAKLGANHLVTLITKNNLAVLYRDMGKYPQAETLLRAVVDGCTIKLGPGHPNTLTYKNSLAALYWRMKKLDRSIPLLEDVLEQRRKKLPAGHPDTLLVLGDVAVNYRDAGRQGDCIRCLEEAVAALRKLPEPIPAELAWLPHALAESYDRAKQHAKSEPLYRDFLRQGRRHFGAADPRTAGLMAQLGLNLLAQKKHPEAELLLRDCLAVRRKKQPDAWTTFGTRSMLGEALLGQKKYTDAEPLLLAGYDGMKKREKLIPPQGKVRLTEAVERLVQIYEAMDNKDAAAKWRKEREAIQAAHKKTEKQP